MEDRDWKQAKLEVRIPYMPVDPAAAEDALTIPRGTVIQWSERGQSGPDWITAYVPALERFVRVHRLSIEGCEL